MNCDENFAKTSTIAAKRLLIHRVENRSLRVDGT